MKYAAYTQVSQEKSRYEIEQVLQKYGASKFAYGWQENQAMIGFQAQGRSIRFLLPLPQIQAETPDGRKIAHPTSHRDQAQRQRWRALLLAVKAKLEAVESGISTFEDEFMAFVVLPDGHTVSEHLRPMITEMYKTNRMPAGFLEIGPGENRIQP